jgi:hypothetical protein
MTDAERLTEWLTLIRDIADDYDGYRAAEDLMGLVDELREMAEKALNGESVQWERLNPPE